MKIFIIIVLILTFAGFVSVINKFNSNTQINHNPTVDLSSSPQSSNGEEVAKQVTANFEIYTNGTKRVFTDARYHHQSEDVYIDSSNTNVVIVNPYAEKQPTWGDFFDTLPMTLTNDCLITGTGQEFCTNETHQLSFVLDGENTPDALDSLINRGAFLRVEYSRR